jgi:phospholipase C
MSTFIISRNDTNNSYQVWLFDPGGQEIFDRQPVSEKAVFDPAYKLASLGGYLLAWGPVEGEADKKQYPYRLFEFDPESHDPLGGKTIQQGAWPQKKFWSYRSYYSNNPKEHDVLPLIPMGGNFMLFFVGGEGRGTYNLWNFDPNFLAPNTSDPLSGTYTPQGGFPTIQAGHELISIGNYVLDRFPDGSTYRIWSFDPQNLNPLSIPEVKKGTWYDIDSHHHLVPLGNMILSWVPGELSYTLWGFDPMAENPFNRIISKGFLPEEIARSTSITGFETRSVNSEKVNAVPGSMAYMRSKIKHVVFYMLESRSFDNVCGWLYENDQAPVNYIGSNEPFKGASADYFNWDGDKKVPLNKYKDGVLSDQWDLQDQRQDPFHDNSDGLQQMFYTRYPGYAGKGQPDMGGFVSNNANHDVMLSFTPAQLTVMNGLAKSYAISDEWFSSVPGGTDINRGFAVSGSAMNRLDTWEGGNTYELWPKFPHRPSLWKVLWNNGISDWKIYNAIEWANHPFTYHLYLEGQVPSIDQHTADFIDSVENFKTQALNGSLPSFSFLEPVWVAPKGTSSYHPGAPFSLVPAEVTLNEIYEAIRKGPHWENTLLVITFSKPGGIYDHVSPPYAAKPWPNDGVDGFRFDLMGPRVPAILVSPWVKPRTVFRSGGPTPFDATSFAATLLNWYGIPRSRWGLGDRMDQAPTFEGVFLEKDARKDAPAFVPPYDKGYPQK